MNSKIKRLAVAVEMEDGKTFVLYTDSDDVELKMESEASNKVTYDQRMNVVRPLEPKYGIYISNMATLSYTVPSDENNGKHLRSIELVEDSLGINETPDIGENR